MKVKIVISMYINFKLESCYFNYLSAVENIQDSRVKIWDASKQKKILDKAWNTLLTLFTYLYTYYCTRSANNHTIYVTALAHKTCHK